MQCSKEKEYELNGFLFLSRLHSRYLIQVMHALDKPIPKSSKVESRQYKEFPCKVVGHGHDIGKIDNVIEVLFCWGLQSSVSSHTGRAN
jgi:hypothetical protein